MPTAEEHRAQAQLNEEFYARIGGIDSEWPDWALTTLFYVAVHEIQAFLADNRATVIGYGIRWPVAEHHERKKALRQHPAWNGLAQRYDVLYGASRKTRYECHSPDKTELEKRRQTVDQIRAEIERLG